VSSDSVSPLRPAQRRTSRSQLSTSGLPRPGDELIQPSRAEQAALYIRRLIFDRHLSPGAHVPQDDIAAALGVSRVPVREALIALEREGWVTIETHRGAFVQALDENAVRDHYEIYGLIYGFAARKALERSPDGLVNQLAALEKDFGKADHAAMAHKALAFHRTVAEAAASPRIGVVLRSMSGLVPESFFEAVPEAIQLERKGMGAVVRAMRAGDGNGAAEAYATMMQTIGERVVALFTERGLFEPPSDSNGRTRTGRQRSAQLGQRLS
jgi:DNA-binding GntR family transcriptional regulator